MKEIKTRHLERACWLPSACSTDSCRPRFSRSRRALQLLPLSVVYLSLACAAPCLGQQAARPLSGEEKPLARPCIAPALTRQSRAAPLRAKGGRCQGEQRGDTRRSGQCTACRSPLPLPLPRHAPRAHASDHCELCACCARTCRSNSAGAGVSLPSSLCSRAGVVCTPIRTGRGSRAGGAPRPCCSQLLVCCCFFLCRDPHSSPPAPLLLHFIWTLSIALSTHSP